MRIVSFNVENMFSRAKAMNLDGWKEGRPALEAHQALNSLFNKPVYTSTDKNKMLKLLEEQGMLKSNEGRLLILREIRGKCIKRSKGKVAIVASGRSDWIGWAELKTEAVKEAATQNTARVIAALNADVVGVVEAEDRTTLRLFNETVIPSVGGIPFQEAMVIDGNDERGIDVGILTRTTHPIVSIRTHVFDQDHTGTIFSRDCAEYELALPAGGTLWVLVNHLKSKGYGSQAANNAKRERQARRVREIVDTHLQDGDELVVVLGDFNESPDNAPLTPLLRQSSVLKDISKHPSFANGGRAGTYGNCTPSNKFDYILLSPKLFDLVVAGGYERRGMWGGATGTLWPHFPEVKMLQDAASDHAAVWAEFNL